MYFVKGELNHGHFSQDMLIQDFRELHSTVKRSGLLKASYPFFAFMFLHAFLIDIASWLVIWYFGKTWTPFLIGVALFTIAQVNVSALLGAAGFSLDYSGPVTCLSALSYPHPPKHLA